MKRAYDIEMKFRTEIKTHQQLVYSGANCLRFVNTSNMYEWEVCRTYLLSAITCSSVIKATEKIPLKNRWNLFYPFIKTLDKPNFTLEQLYPKWNEYFKPIDSVESEEKMVGSMDIDEFTDMLTSFSRLDYIRYTPASEREKWNIPDVYEVIVGPEAVVQLAKIIQAV
jgi:hypothetical protein